VCFQIAFKRMLCVSIRLMAPKTIRCQKQVKLAEREDVVWQAGKT
jgi:hypothetical protein